MAGSTPGSLCCCTSCPLLIDLDGGGFRLTDARHGVRFDIGGDGNLDQVSWIEAGSTNAWLVLDRNDNGIIDNGTELFGNMTVQPPPPEGIERNGFNALSEFDKPSSGGNGDGRIDVQDSVFPKLRVWQDSNHNGVSDASELKSLAAVGITGISLMYRESRRMDEFGNRFRYRGVLLKSQGADVSRVAWDVFLLTTNEGLMKKRSCRQSELNDSR